MKKASILGVTIFAVILLFLTTAGSAVSNYPSARGYPQMAYDSESGLVILYGGQIGGPWLDPTTWSYETWAFNPRSEKWKLMSPETTPVAHSGGDMAYDSKADRIILSIITDDLSTLQTWAYDANNDTWTQLADVPRAPMLGQRIVYDSESDRIIMFGGFNMTNYTFVHETWVYDYNTNTWTNMKPNSHPSGRNYVGMVYDSKADRAVLWGDWLKNYTSGTDDAVWTYDYNTNTWQEFKHRKDGPEVRDYMMMAYDEKADKILMYGGYEYGNDETWTYDLNTDTWQQMQPENNPGVISRYAMVYVEDTNETILFGGQDGETHYLFNNETWSYDLKHNKWVNMSP